MTLKSQTIHDIIPSSDMATIHKAVLWCTNDALLYSMNLFVPSQGASVSADSIRLNGMIQEHPQIRPADAIRADIAATLDAGLPIVLQGSGSLMMPIQIPQGTPAAKAVAEIIYISGGDTTCHLDSFEPHVGGLFPLGIEFGVTMHEATKIGISDFNEYLHNIGEDWQMYVTTQDTLNRNVVEIVDEIGAQVYVGPPTVASVLQLTEHRPDIVAVSCCATSNMLDTPDHIFRTAPGDSMLAAQMARIMIHNGLDVLLPVRVDDVWTNAYLDDITKHFAALGGTIDEGVVAEPDSEWIIDPDTHNTGSIVAVPGSLAERAGDIGARINYLVDMYGADSIAVFVAPLGDAEFFEAMAAQDGADAVRWFGTDYTFDYFTDNQTVMSFMSNTGFTTVQVESSGPDIYEAQDRIKAVIGRAVSHDMLAAYESAWILGLAIQHSQSTDAYRVAEAIPRVAQSHLGVFGPIALDMNGDLAPESYEVWSVVDGQWSLVGIMN